MLSANSHEASIMKTTKLGSGVCAWAAGPDYGSCIRDEAFTFSSGNGVTALCHCLPRAAVGVSQENRPENHVRKVSICFACQAELLPSLVHLSSCSGNDGSMCKGSVGFGLCAITCLRVDEGKPHEQRCKAITD